MELLWVLAVILLVGDFHVLRASFSESASDAPTHLPERLVGEYSPKSRSSLIWNNKTSSDCGVQSLDGGHKRKYKVLIFLDSGYVDVFHNWYLHYTAVCGDSQDILDRLAIVCIDKDSSNVLRPFHLSCLSDFSADLQATMPKAFEEMRRERDNSQLMQYRSRKIVRHVIWMKRLEIVSVLLQRGEDVLLSDLDAIWLQNPYAD
ncbi:hypothetical protein EON65_58405, partial [archaeon]